MSFVSLQLKRGDPQKMKSVPTVYPCSTFDPCADAEVLHKAMGGLGTDENALISILCHRTSTQRVQIAESFKSLCGKELIEEINCKTSADFKNVMVALCRPKVSFLAIEINKALCGTLIGTNEAHLIQILCSSTDEEIRDIVAAYNHLYPNESIKNAIIDNTSGTFKAILVLLIQGCRNESKHVNATKVQEDAQCLYDEEDEKLGTEESNFFRILTTESWSHILLVMQKYDSTYGESFEEAVHYNFAGYTKIALLTIINCAQNRCAYYAECIHQCVARVGTKDRSLIRWIVSRSDVDLGSIKEEYAEKYGKTLAADVAGDTSGDYKKALLALIG